MNRFSKTTQMLICVAALGLPSAVLADDVTDTLESALKAYQDGDLKYAMEELDFARQLIKAQNTASLTTFLPDGPDGWTREVSTEVTAGLAMMGGGAGAEASYSMGDERFTITLMADNPMVGALAGMLGSAGLMGMKLERVGRMKYLNQDGELSGIIDNRILIQAKGASADVMIPVLEGIDVKGLSDFGG